MRILLLLACLILSTATAAHAEDVEGYAFYPPGNNPMYGLIVRGTVIQKKVIIGSATTATGSQPGTLVLTAAGQKLSLDKAKPGSRLNVIFNVDVNQPGFHTNRVDVTMFYPFKLTKLPNITLKAGGTEFKKVACRRKPNSPKVSEAFATIQLPPAIANKMHFGDNVLLTVFDETGTLLEQSGFTICPEKGFKAMLAEAKKDLWSKTGGPDDGTF
ncbi:MAG: hypothetical protein JST89_06645 [Cyanobacteria bacterium SZAS-4]|nr:hypothetical protein [Cyanobacteria bacterium SZAS-4]